MLIAGIVGAIFLFLNEEDKRLTLLEGDVEYEKEHRFIPREAIGFEDWKEFDIPAIEEELVFIKKYFSENTEVLIYISEKKTDVVTQEYRENLNKDGWNKIMSTMGSDVFEKGDVVISIYALPITDEDRKNYGIERGSTIVMATGDFREVWEKTILSEPPIYIPSKKMDLSSEDMREGVEKLKEIVSPNAEILLYLTEDEHRSVGFWYFSTLNELGWEIAKDDPRFKLWEKDDKGIYVSITGYTIVEEKRYTSIFIIKDNIEVWEREGIFEELEQF